MINNHTIGAAMSTTKIAITLDIETLRQLDALVERQLFPNRSRAIQAAVQEKLDRITGNRLAAECARLEVVEEQELAEEGNEGGEDSWPRF
jgi:metal-responsive CopG/Arc/MetJ family transcriptional regulator